MPMVIEKIKMPAELKQKHEAYKSVYQGRYNKNETQSLGWLSLSSNANEKKEHKKKNSKKNKNSGQECGHKHLEYT